MITGDELYKIAHEPYKTYQVQLEEIIDKKLIEFYKHYFDEYRYYDDNDSCAIFLDELKYKYETICEKNEIIANYVWFYDGFIPRMISRYKEKNIQVKKDKRGNRDVYLFKIM